ncbi:ATP-binding protein, partial [Acinetobacter baumannii]
MHMILSERISLMIRGVYVVRNPNTGKLQQHLQNGYERLQTRDLNAKRFDDNESTSHSMAIIGCSGSGKTTSLRRILNTYPQVIFHPTLNRHQILYLNIDCSHDVSLKALCLNFFRSIDKIIGSNYEKKYGMKRHGVETMLALIAQTANMFALG